MSYRREWAEAKETAEKRIFREYVLQLAGRSKSGDRTQEIVNTLIHKVLSPAQIALVQQWVREEARGLPH